MTSQSSKVAFLTGSTSGIGQATAQELVRHVSILILPVRTDRERRSPPKYSCFNDNFAMSSKLK